jgi:hypothetical protein
MLKVEEKTSKTLYKLLSSSISCSRMRAAEENAINFSFRLSMPSKSLLYALASFLKKKRAQRAAAAVRSNNIHIRSETIKTEQILLLRNCFLSLSV